MISHQVTSKTAPLPPLRILMTTILLQDDVTEVLCFSPPENCHNLLDPLLEIHSYCKQLQAVQGGDSMTKAISCRGNIRNERARASSKSKIPPTQYIQGEVANQPELCSFWQDARR